MLLEFGMFIKLAVDIERRILAGGGEMHYYCEQDLLADGSKQKNIWGAGFEPYIQKVTYDSLINIRAPQNRSMEITDPIIKQRVAEIIIELLGGI
ncbi:hypothetical protein NIES4071_24960 [Calothrix sp. NIES-4071]|nr:hypothetical protein NIES4071_24960 [Calothrix sp. NIES-4071]BAZ56819.1 hypothetical protein NIES4105_24900 [Calothrix sp. NIES-4105]